MSTAPLRRDLESIQVDAGVRPYRIVVDEVSGRFSRVAEHVWQRLQSGSDDPELLAQANAAGWTRQRGAAVRKRFSFLAIRIPLGGIDRLARWLLPISGILFSVKAILAFSFLIAISAMIAVSRSAELFASLGSLTTYLQQSSPLLIGVVFVLTKACHELGHAVMCRRMGSRCGGIGILLLCGMPSPYCDVTNIWRQGSAIKRIAVMLAGIYVELVIASIATFVWCFASDPAIRLFALNLMIVCGISTIVFNANPLMRYDGYFVLADILDSVNLRQEAQQAFRGVVTRRLAGANYHAALKSDRRSILLAAYHGASKIYRLVVTCAIAGLLIGFATWIQLRPLAIGLVLIAAFMAMMRSSKRLGGVASGADRWASVPFLRRGLTSGLVMVFALTVLFIPLPRYQKANGIVDAANAVSVYLPDNALIQDVAANFGESVRKGDLLVRVDDQQHTLRQKQLIGQLRLARLRSNLSHRSALDGHNSARTQSADQWQTLQAAEDSVSVQLASVVKQLDKTKVTAPASGMVIPSKPMLKTSANGSVITLSDKKNSLGSTRDPWCRISRSGDIHAALVIDARDRPSIAVGSAVRISLACSPSTVINSVVVSVSEIKRDERAVVGQSAYQVLCRIPPVTFDQLVSMVGQECRGVFQLPRKSFASDIRTWLGDWISG